ncbi:hypothetical protein HanPSC8_Chr14g0628271 [Helianthus annuus]|nr:hypothetical protein HanPSC8_Chr14g0628271 [Helianthus annuus]
MWGWICGFRSTGANPVLVRVEFGSCFDIRLVWVLAQLSSYSVLVLGLLRLIRLSSGQFRCGQTWSTAVFGSVKPVNWSIRSRHTG